MTKSIESLNIKLTENCLKDKVYLVTGASGGLGKATAIYLAEYGATVVLTAKNDKKLEATYDEIESKGYSLPALIPFDLEQNESEQYTQLIQSIYNEFKQLDGIVNAACEMGVVGPLDSQVDSIWQKVQQVNVNAGFLLSKAGIPLLQQSPASSITFISDSSARNNNAYWGAYGVSKVALESFSHILADELEATSINSNVFIPGPSVLPIRKKTHPGEDESSLTTPNVLAEAIVKVILSNSSGQTYTL